MQQKNAKIGEILYILAKGGVENYSGEAVSQLEHALQCATLALQAFPSSQIKLLSGPRQGLVMLRVRASVADSQFNSGEILVTEVKLELEGQFGFGMVIGDSHRQVLAVAIVDAAIRKGGSLTLQLEQEIAKLEQQLTQKRQQFYNLVATSKVEFETF
jgi:alpha-D-ribose 1-methylphosphonate 5-triphosphate synthase subunit PhnG